MGTLWQVGQFVIGLAILVFGADLLVRSASFLARSIGMSPVVIGLTVVAFGTSAPELAISLQAAFQGQPEIALGNVIGSNIANILLVIGLSALIVPLTVAYQIVRLDVPLMAGASVLVLLLSLNGTLGRTEGALLFFLLLLYLVYTVRQVRRDTPPAIEAEYAAEYGNAQELDSSPRVRSRALARNLLLLAAGLALTVWGARMLVDSASALARSIGISELIIGLTVVAVGTSAPEIATSLVAAARGERDIAVGNAVGSNIFNLLCVLGLTAVLSPKAIPIPRAAITFDLPVMVLVALLCLPIFYSRFTIRRWEAGFFVAGYLAYTMALFLLATESSTLAALQKWLFYFVVPLSLLVMVMSLLSDRRIRSRTFLARSDVP